MPTEKCSNTSLALRIGKTRATLGQSAAHSRRVGNPGGVQVSEAEDTAAPRRRGLLWVGPLAAIVGAAIALLYDADNGLRTVWSVKTELRRADVRLAKLWSERNDLVARADRLRGDSFEIESVARESLGMVRPGEIVVRLRTAPE